MKKVVLAVLFAMITFAASSQVQTAGFNDSLINTSDTVSLPVIKEQQFNSFSLLSKQRLDSITNIIPLSYNEFVQQYITIYTSQKEMLGKMLGLSAYYFPIFEKALKAYDLPEEIKYLPIIESAMDPAAVSKHGATGLWQFMFATAKGYGLVMDNFEDQRKDPVQSSYAAAAYFRDAYEELGDWLLALAAYNCGKGNVTKAMAKAGSKDFWEIRPFLPKETRNYVPAFIAAVYSMKYAAQHHVNPPQQVFLKAADTILVDRFVSLHDLSVAMQADESLLAALNPSFKQKIINGTPQLSKRLVIPHCDEAAYAAVYEVLNNSNLPTTKEIIPSANDDKRLVKNTVKSKTPAKPQKHKVLAGETLSGIADKYNLSLKELLALNNLKSSTIVPGQQLNVSHNKSVKNTKETVQFITYKVKKGDTLSEIAERFEGTTVSTIKRDNNLNSAKLQEGMLLKIFKG